MVKRDFKMLYWGVLFIMVDFRFFGFDIFPDIIGYIFFLIGLGQLSSINENFSKARVYSIPMIFISLLSIYEIPAQDGGVNFGPFVAFGIIIMLAAIVLNLLIFFHILKGIKEMAELQGYNDIGDESDRRWHQYIMLQIAIVPAFIFMLIPFLAFVYIIAILIASIVMTVLMMRLMKRCSETLI